MTDDTEREDLRELHRFLDQQNRTDRFTYDELKRYTQHVYKELRIRSGGAARYQPYMYGYLPALFDTEPGMDGHLGLEWTIDAYLGYMVERYILGPWPEVQKRLGGYTKRKPFVYNDLDNEAWVDGNALVHNFQTYNTVCMFNGSVVFNEIWVREYWKRFVWEKIGDRSRIKQPTLNYYKNRRYDILQSEHGIYGDARDPGHILTFVKVNKLPGKCEKGYWHLPEALAYLQRHRFLLDELGLLRETEAK